MKFLGLCPSILSWYLEFASHSPPPRPLLRPTLSLHESKGSMTPWKSHLCVTMTLPAHGPTIRCLASASLSSCSVGPPLRHYGTPPSPPPFQPMLCFWVAKPLWTRCFLAPFDHLLQHLCVLLAVLLS
ncbi:hypothetical protein BHM03_00048699 [Ensete ventricosum]|nr:hypothetical protein BHM03_00048699 [Ensete ventricosum]